MSNKLESKSERTEEIEIETINEESVKSSSKKKHGFFKTVSVKVRFKTYNTRRRCRAFFRSSALAVKKFITVTAIESVKGAGREFKEICKETGRLPAQIKSKRSEGKGVFSAFGSSLAESYNAHRDFHVCVRNIALPVICIAVLAIVAANLSARSYALEVSCNGEVLGYVEDEQVYNEALQLLKQRVPNESEDYRSILSPTYSVTTASQNLQMNSEALCEAILADSDNVENAYGLYIEGELCAAVKSYGDARYIMETFLNSYSTGAKDETVSFLGKTELVAGLYSTDKIVSSEDFAKTISTRRKETQLYTVQPGDTAQSIATVADMSYERLKALNEDITDTPAEGTSIIVEKQLPVLAVQTIRTETVKETIPYTKKKIQDSSQYVGYSKCTKKGENGQRSVVQQVTEINGVEVAKDVLSSTVIKKPVEAVYVVGTKKASSVGSGSFLWPLPGVHTLSSPYGYRWGKLHAGIDISTSGVYGRTIVASDSGTVTVKNSPNGYGLHVIISHNNGYSTCYAHMSAVSVSNGQTVAKGQAIGKVGNSGRSTGAHLHFEIRLNGSSRNPMNYF